jgi:hypothetical protein
MSLSDLTACRYFLQTEAQQFPLPWHDHLTEVGSIDPRKMVVEAWLDHMFAVNMESINTLAMKVLTKEHHNSSIVL